MHQHTARNEKEPAISDPRTNERIRVPEVRLVGPAGEQVGVVRVEDALRLAREAELDLVEVAPEARPPVVKIMDFGKFKYEQAQKVKDARRNQANTVLKEVRFRLKIDEHDYETKRKRAEGFLQAGDKVKAMILFRGREQSRPDQGVRLLQRFAEDVAEFGSVESSPMIDGRNMVMIVGPMRSKSDAKAELNAVRSAQRAADQEKRRIEAERQAARQAELDAKRPARPVLPASSAVTSEAEFRSRPSTGSSSSSTGASGSSSSSRPSTGASRPASSASSRPATGATSRPSSASRPSSDASSDSRPRQQPRTVQPTPAGAPRPAAAAPRPTSASAPVKPGTPAAAPAAPKPAVKPGTPKPAAKPATSSAASKPAAPKAKPAGPPAGEPASE